MAYSPATKFPKLLQASQLSRPDAQNPRLAQPINATQTTIELTCVPQNYDGTALTGNCHFGIAGAGTTETVFCIPGGISGSTLTVVRGIRPNGIDYTTGDSDFATAHAQDSAVFFDVSAIHYQLINAAITGDIPTGDNNLKVGALTASDIRNFYSNDQTDKPYDYYDESAQRPRFHMGDDGPSAGLELEGVILKGTTAQLNALPELPTLGMVAGDTTLGVTVFREGGVWVPNASGGTVVDASTTVAGKGQVSTTTAANNATDAGSTGAVNWMPPSQTARVIQEARYIYAASTTGNDTYLATFTPTAPAVANGQTYNVKVDTANTGACSLNGVAIKLKDGNDPNTGDIKANSINPFTYNSTGPKWELQCPVANVILTSSNLDQPFNDFSSSITRYNLDDSRGGSYVIGSGAITNYGSGYGYTSAALPSEQGGSIIDFTYNGDISGKSPKFFARVIYAQTTAQDGIMGFNDSVVVQNVNNVYVGDHAAFLVDDAHLVASVANGTTQQKSSNLEGTYPITSLHNYYIEVVGGHYLFYIDGVLVFTSSADEPNSSLVASLCALKAAAVRTLEVYQHSISFNKA